MIPIQELAQQFRPQMLEFAKRQLSDAEQAEDAVQETFLAALKSAEKFRGEAAYKTWIFAILKNKITDSLRARYRKQAREIPLLVDEDATMDELFIADGHWDASHIPSDLGNPEAVTYRQQFWELLQTCLDNLPGVQGRAFLMREYLGLDTDEICNQLEITTTNLNVMLYRARLRLQQCLKTKGVQSS